MSNDDAIMVEPRVNRRQLLIGAGAAGAAAAVGLASSVTPVAAASSDSSWIVGAWEIVITPDANQGPPQPGVITFAPGGVVTDVDANSPSTGVGGWKADDDGRINLTFRNFSFDSNGNAQGMATINVTVHSKNDGKGFSGRYKVTATDLSGQTTFFQGTGAVSGKHLAIHGA